MSRLGARLTGPRPTPGWGGRPRAGFEERETFALDRCDEMIRWYERTKSLHRNAHQLFNMATIILGTLAPFILLLEEPLNLSTAGAKALAVLPASVAAVVAGLAGLYKWQENWLRFAVAAESLKSERVQYVTRASEDYRPPRTDEQALDRFVRRMEAILMSELGEWRVQSSQTRTSDQPPGGGSGAGGNAGGKTTV
jgi:hypothetical protein